MIRPSSLENNKNQNQEVNNNNIANLKKQYEELKIKVMNLEKNNLEMIQMYEAEEERLIKSNEFLQNVNNKENPKSIQELEQEVLKLRNDCQSLKELLEQKNKTLKDLNASLNDNNININNINSSKENDDEIETFEIKNEEEYLKNYKEQLEKEFEEKINIKYKKLLEQLANKENNDSNGNKEKDKEN